MRMTSRTLTFLSMLIILRNWVFFSDRIYLFTSLLKLYLFPAVLHRLSKPFRFSSWLKLRHI